MANPTTNFGWVMPTSSSLVTNLPADFNTFGQAVDTSMSELLGGTTGQVLSKTSNTNMDFTWVTPTDQTPLTTKGDLFTFTTVDARLGVGSDGQVLTASSAAATGLAWAAPSSGATSLGFTAGKNAIINGAFNVWQRGTSFTNPAASAYVADRFAIDYNTGTVACVVSQQTFTPGTAPVSGYESQYFLRVSQSAATASKFIYVGQKIEDVRTFAGQTVTFSFWAKANASKTLKSRSVQVFGSGGSGAVVTTETSNTVTTSWTRFTNTITVGSVSGKTIGTGSYILFDLNWDSNAIQDIDIWGWQVESGSTATAFQTATGTLQGELAACQRYYYRTTATQVYSDFGSGYSVTATEASFMIPYPVTMRTTPSALEQSGTASNYNVLHASGGAAARTVCTSVPSYSVATPTMARIQFIVAGGLTSGNGSIGGSNNNTTAYLGWSAEL